MGDSTRPRGFNPEQINSFRPGISVESMLDVPNDCQGTWVPKGGKYYLKFASSACPCKYCREYFKQ